MAHGHPCGPLQLDMVVHTSTASYKLTTTLKTYYNIKYAYDLPTERSDVC